MWLPFLPVNLTLLRSKPTARSQHGVMAECIPRAVAGSAIQRQRSRRTFTPATPLRLTSLQRLSDGSFSFRAIDPGGRELLPFNLSSIEVQGSTNLQDWAVVPGVSTLTNGSLLVRDPNSTNFPVQFYRLIEH